VFDWCISCKFASAGEREATVFVRVFVLGLRASSNVKYDCGDGLGLGGDG
jgi:hypothetical protein